MARPRVSLCGVISLFHGRQLGRWVHHAVQIVRFLIYYVPQPSAGTNHSAGCHSHTLCYHLWLFYRYYGLFGILHITQLGRLEYKGATFVYKANERTTSVLPELKFNIYL